MVKAVRQKDPASWCHELPEGLTTCTVHSHTIRKQGLGYSFVAFIHIQKKDLPCKTCMEVDSSHF